MFRLDICSSVISADKLCLQWGSSRLDQSDDLLHCNDFDPLQPWHVKGPAQPDTILHFEVDGVEYIATANEGDAKAVGKFEDDDWVSQKQLCMQSLHWLWYQCIDGMCCGHTLSFTDHCVHFCSISCYSGEYELRCLLSDHLYSRAARLCVHGICLDDMQLHARQRGLKFHEKVPDDLRALPEGVFEQMKVASQLGRIGMLISSPKIDGNYTDMYVPSSRSWSIYKAT